MFEVSSNWELCRQAFHRKKWIPNGFFEVIECFASFKDSSHAQLRNAAPAETTEWPSQYNNGGEFVCLDKDEDDRS